MQGAFIQQYTVLLLRVHLCNDIELKKGYALNRQGSQTCICYAMMPPMVQNPILPLPEVPGCKVVKI